MVFEKTINDLKIKNKNKSEKIDKQETKIKELS